MRVKLRKVGNSYALTVPADVVAELGLTEGVDLDVVIREDGVVYAPIVEPWDAMRAKLRKQAESLGIGEADIDEAVEQVRRGEPASE
jgi:antitoxin component of MazEF toxin-antitoxin module